MRRTLWRCLVGLLVLGLSAALQAQSLQFYTEEYPPLNYSRDGRPVGLAVDCRTLRRNRLPHQVRARKVPAEAGRAGVLAVGSFAVAATDRRCCHRWDCLPRNWSLELPR